MKQTQDKSEQKSKEDNLAQHRKSFQEEKENEIQVPTTRIVRLWYKACCGCGCETIWLERQVPFGSSLKDGDEAERFNEGDRQLDRKPKDLTR
jgi:hypothetical protein